MLWSQVVGKQAPATADEVQQLLDRITKPLGRIGYHHGDGLLREVHVFLAVVLPVGKRRLVFDVHHRHILVFLNACSTTTTQIMQTTTYRLPVQT